MCGTETEVKATQRLPYLGIHPINSQQTLTLLWMTRSAYQKEHAMVVSGGALPEPYKYRGRNYQQTIGLGVVSSVEELEGSLEELKVFTAPWEEQRCWPPRCHKTPRD